MVECGENPTELENGPEVAEPRGCQSSFCRPFSVSNEEPGFPTSVEDKEQVRNHEPPESVVIFEKDGIPYITGGTSLPNEGAMAGLDGDFARLVDSVLGGGSGRPSR